MRKLFFAALTFAIGALIFYGCRPEQSEFDLSTLTEKATISGQIVYDAGVDTTANAYTINMIKPASERVVYVEIPYASYKAGSDGVKRYETITDAEGYYTIEVPTTPDGIENVQIRMQEFTAYRSEYKKMEAGKPVFETKLYRFSYEPAPFTLNPGSMEFMKESDKACSYTLVDLEGFEESITLKGNIQLAQEVGFRQGVYTPAANATVEFVASYSGVTDELTFGTTTDASGNYSITLPLKSYEEGFQNLSASVRGMGQNYTHYNAVESTMKLSGAYKSADILSNISATDIIEGMDYEMETMYMKFQPGYNGLTNSTDGVRPSTWAENLAGWEKYDGFTETKTVTGRYLLAVESGFGVGTYANPRQEAKVVIEYPGNDNRGMEKVVYVNTDAEGNFSFEVPVKDAEESLSVSFASLGNTILFDHYMLPDKMVKLEGKYQTEVAEMKELATLWNEMGTAYYAFTPTPSADLDEMQWSGNLAGWKQATALENEYEGTQVVTANVWIPVETALGVGEYKNANNLLVEFSVDGETYVAPVINGAVNMTVYTQNNSSEPNVSVTSATLKEKNFKHFEVGGKEKILVGKYATYYSTPADKREAWNQLGDVYLKFTPDNAPDNWDQWYSYLAGWVRIGNVEPAAQNVTGTLYMAKETAYAAGTYAAAANTLVRAVVNGTVFVGVTDQNGAYSIPVLFNPTSGTPSVSVVPFFVENEVEYKHYTTADASETQDVVYSAYNSFDTRIDGYTPWYDRGTIYYKSPVSSENLLDWVNKENEVTKEYRNSLNISFTVKEAIEKVNGSVVEAAWTPATALRKVRVYVEEPATGFVGSYVTSVTSSKNISVKVKSVESSYSVVIMPEDGTSAQLNAFRHYEDNSKPTVYSTIYGYYASADNAVGVFSVEGNSLIKVTPSAKMNFIPVRPSSMPDGWSTYVWDITAD